MRNLAAAFALVLFSACAGSYTPGGGTLGGDGSIGNAQDAGDGGDGGADAGDAGDGGPDAGCEARSLNGSAVDNCQGGAFATVSGTVAGPTQGCAVSISLSTASSPCLGVANRGTLDGFDGGCGGGALTNCTSPSLPGTITCTVGISTCTIVICDGGTCP